MDGFKTFFVGYILFLSESQALEQCGEKGPLPPDQTLLLQFLFLYDL